MQRRDIKLDLEVISSNFHLSDCHGGELSEASHEPALREMAPRSESFPFFNTTPSESDSRHKSLYWTPTGLLRSHQAKADWEHKEEWPHFPPPSTFAKKSRYADKAERNEQGEKESLSFSVKQNQHLNDGLCLLGWQQPGRALAVREAPPFLAPAETCFFCLRDANKTVQLIPDLHTLERTGGDVWTRETCSG